MKKQKKKRETKKPMFKGDPAVDPLEIIIVDGQEMLMLFSLSNRALKMIKCGEVFEKNFVRDGKRCRMQFMHRDVYMNGYKQAIDLKIKMQEKMAKKEKDDSKKDDAPAENAVE